MGERQPVDEDIQDALDWARQRLKEMGVFEAEDGLRWANFTSLMSQTSAAPKSECG